MFFVIAEKRMSLFRMTRTWRWNLNNINNTRSSALSVHTVFHRRCFIKCCLRSNLIINCWIRAVIGGMHVCDMLINSIHSIAHNNLITRCYWRYKSKKMTETVEKGKQTNIIFALFFHLFVASFLANQSFLHFLMHSITYVNVWWKPVTANQSKGLQRPRPHTLLNLIHFVFLLCCEIFANFEAEQFVRALCISCCPLLLLEKHAKDNSVCTTNPWMVQRSSKYEIIHSAIASWI